MYSAKEFSSCMAPDNILYWLERHPNCRPISTYEKTGIVSLLYEVMGDEAGAEKKKNVLLKKETIDAPKWIYSDPSPMLSGDDAIKWEEIDEALGFKLFYWQKSYIQSGEFRHTGQTTAVILHDLLVFNPHQGPIHLARVQCKAYLIDMYITLRKKLTDAGIPCREVIVTMY